MFSSFWKKRKKKEKILTKKMNNIPFSIRWKNEKENETKWKRATSSNEKKKKKAMITSVGLQ